MKFKIDLEIQEKEHLGMIAKYILDNIEYLTAPETDVINLPFIGGHLTIEKEGTFAPFQVVDDNTSEVLGYFHDEKEAKLMQYNEESAYVRYPNGS